MYIMHAGLGDHRLVRVQFDLHELHVVADDLVVHFVHGRHWLKELLARPVAWPGATMASGACLRPLHYALARGGIASIGGEPAMGPARPQSSSPRGQDAAAGHGGKPP